jgi:hypothetical protein
MSIRLQIALGVVSCVAVLSLLVWKRNLFPAHVEKKLDALRRWWLETAKKIGHVQSVILLFLLYLTGIAVTAIFAYLFRKDFLRLREPARWIPRKAKKDTLETLARQF